jgi:hypothetical protein
VRRLDAELAEFEGAAASPETQRAVLDAAEAARAIEPGSARVVRVVVDAGTGSDALARRARVGGWFTVRNLVVVAASTVAGGFGAQPGADLYKALDPVTRMERFLESAPQAIDDLLRDAPADLRAAYQSVREMIRDRARARPPPSQTGPH